MVRLLHTADLHLGMRLTRFSEETAGKIIEMRMKCLEEILDIAKKQEVDFALIAGDLFDDASADRTTAARAYELISEKSPCTIFVLPGNHDPLIPGSVWDRPPWNDARQPVVVLRERRGYAAPGGASVIGAPLFWRRSREDPLGFAVPERSEKFRVGAAHGSLSGIGVPIDKDDNPISSASIAAARLDYLALGHWHGMRRYDDLRAAYSGTPEPMGFGDAGAQELGWIGMEGVPGGEEGCVLIVTLEEKHNPVIEPVRVARLAWRSEERSVTSQTNWGSEIVDHFASLPDQEQTILRLVLKGEMTPEGQERLEELEQIVRGRYFAAEVNSDALAFAPGDEEIRETVGEGVLRRVYEELRAQAAQDVVAKRAFSLLYKLAKEAQK